jgi:hypothetical protein
VPFEVPYPHAAPREYSIRYKDSLPEIIDIFEGDLFSDRLCLYPERRYIQRAGGGLMRLWEENSSGDDWWDVQVGVSSVIVYYALTFAFQTMLGDDTIVIHLQIYMDSTHMTSFGNVKYWGVFLWIGNAPKAERSDRGGRGRAILIAYLPTVISYHFIIKCYTDHLSTGNRAQE